MARCYVLAEVKVLSVEDIMRETAFIIVNTNVTDIEADI